MLVTFSLDKPEAIEALTQLGECLRLKPDDLAPLFGLISSSSVAEKTAAAGCFLKPVHAAFFCREKVTK